jgi:hypothetical protein
VLAIGSPAGSFLDFAQLDKSGGEVGQGGAAMLLERRVEGIEGLGEDRDGVCGSA